MAVTEYRAPRSLEEALVSLEELGEDAKVVAGGQSLMILMREGLVLPQVLVGLRNVEELAGIQVAGPQADGGASIGALATHTEVLSHPDIRARWPVLARAEEAVSTTQIRNRGTLCGNLAHAFPSSDPPAGLIALDAVVHIASRRGRREVPIDEFIVGALTTVLEPDELVTHVSLPPQPEGARYAFVKYAVRPLDFAIVGVGVRVVLDGDGVCTGARVGISGGADRPLRARQAEQVLVGSSLGPDVVSAAADAAAGESEPLEDVFESKEYKRKAIRVYVKRALEEALR